MLLKIVFGLFLIAHGAIHLFYFGQARRLFELGDAMIWPDQSWLFAQMFDVETIRILAALACVLAAGGFWAGGLAFFLGLAWWRPLVIGAAILSSLTYVLFWDGTPKKLPDQGIIGILFNIALIALVVKNLTPT